MSSRDKLIAVAKIAGIPSLVVIALIAGILWEECPPPSGGPIARMTGPTSFEGKIPVGIAATMFVNAFNSAGLLSEPSEILQVRNSGTRIFAWGEKDSLLHWWLPYEGRGTTARDPVGQISGVLDGATWSLGLAEMAFLFDGVDDRVSLGMLEPGGLPLRLEATIQVGAGLVPAISGGGRIIDKSSKTTNYWQLTLYQTRARADSFQIRFRVRTTAGMVAAITPYCIQAGSWYRVVGVYNGRTARVYVDGIPRKSVPWTGTLVAAPTVPAYIGWGGHGGQPFKGKIENVKIGRRTGL